MLMTWLFRLLLVLLVLRALWVLLRGFLEGMGYGATRRPDTKGGALVRDPVCGTFVVPSRALSAGRGADVQYFCSERCRREHGAQKRQPA